jgi:RNA polymerase-binding transcription factor DksA
MANKPSKKPAASAKAGDKSTAAPSPSKSKSGADNGKKTPDKPDIEAKAPAAKGGKVASTSKTKNEPAPKPSPAKKAGADSPISSSVKKTAPSETSPESTTPEAEVEGTEKKAPAKAATPKASKAKAEAPADGAEAPKAAPKKSSAKASKAVTPKPPAAKPVPVPKAKKPILDSAPELVIKQAYNPAKLPPFVKKQQQRLYELRNALLDSMDIVAKDGLRNRAEGSEASVGGMHMADAGSDAYDRDFALSMLSKEQDALYEINEALIRVDQGVYGVCELSGEKINDERLEALPYTRYTREMQEQIERDQMGGRMRRAPVRSVFGLDEDGEGDDDGDEEERPAANNQNESSLDFMKE